MAAIETLLYFIVFPVIIYKILKKHRDELRSKKIRDTYGSLYDGVRTKHMVTILYVLEFLAFRFAFVVITFAIKH